MTHPLARAPIVIAHELQAPAERGSTATVMRLWWPCNPRDISIVATGPVGPRGRATGAFSSLDHHVAARVPSASGFGGSGTRGRNVEMLSGLALAICLGAKTAQADVHSASQREQIRPEPRWL